MQLGHVIAAARHRRKLSQAALAKLLHVTPATVAGWELGIHGVRSARLEALADALGVSVAKLVSR